MRYGKQFGSSQQFDLTVCVACWLPSVCLGNPLSLWPTRLLNCWVFEGWLEIVMVSKVLHFYILFLLWSIWIPEIFFKFWWLVPKLWLTKIWGYFQQKLIFGWKSNFDIIIYRSQHRHLSFLPKYWYIIEIHHKKWKTSMCTCWLLTLAIPEKTKILKIAPTLTAII